MKKRILAVVLTLVLIMGLFPITVSAAKEIKYMDWDDSSKTLVEKTATAEKLTAETNVENIAGWYYVDGDVEINTLIKVSYYGTAHIILTAGSKLTASQGIDVSAGWDTYLYIYGQADGSGELVANGEINCTMGSLAINGGTVTANNGIHCERGAAAGFIMINGGNVTATGGTNSVGIGNNTSKQSDATKQIIINGGTVTAIGGNGPSGENGAAGIVGKVTINGGTVTATGGKASAGNVNKVAAGIVGHDGSHFSGKGVTINGGTVTATGITGDFSVYALGKITASYDYSGGDSDAVSLEDYMTERDYFHYIHIEPRTKDDVAYMDWDSEKKEWVEKTVSAVKIDPQITALADGCWYYVDGSVDKWDDMYYNYYPIRTEGTAYIILTDGCEFTVGAGIEVPSGKSLLIYGQESGTGKLNVTGSISDGIGIGGHGSSTVTINGGIVCIDCYCSIGIGGDGSTVTINGGTVTAIGGGNAPGIGSSYGVNEGTITITGGTVTISGSTKATNVAIENINATVQTSTDGVNWSDWDGKTDLGTFKYLKLTAAHTHTHTLNKVEAKDATCTEDGISTTYYVCEGEGSCGKYFSDVNGENEISAETAQGYTIGKMGHNFTGNYINYEGNKWAKKCSRCDTYETEKALTGVAVPTAKTNLVYNGDAQTGVEEDTGYTLTGNTAKDAGTYTAIATLENGYIWEDGTTTPKGIPWKIISEAAWHLAERYCDSNEGKGYAMGRQGKLISGNVPSEDIGRTIIPLTQKQLEDIGAAVLLLGNDGETEIEVTLDCAYTYFYQKDKSGNVTKITAESMGYAAFLIIDNNGNGGTINGYGYYRLYNDTLDNFMFDCLFVKPETK